MFLFCNFCFIKYDKGFDHYLTEVEDWNGEILPTVFWADLLVGWEWFSKEANETFGTFGLKLRFIHLNEAIFISKGEHICFVENVLGIIISVVDHADWPLSFLNKVGGSTHQRADNSAWLYCSFIWSLMCFLKCEWVQGAVWCFGKCTFSLFLIKKKGVRGQRLKRNHFNSCNVKLQPAAG